MSRDHRIPCAGTALPAQAGLDKDALRRAMAARRRALDAPTKAAYDARICLRLLEWWRGARPDCVAVYWPLAGEPDISAACAELAAHGARLALPVVVARDAPLAFAEWSVGEAMEKDGMGVAVPRQLRMVARPAAIVVPCLGFNDGGFRLGYGGGYYDRTLEAQPRPHTVGVAYSFGRAEFASAPHDVALDLILTEA